MIALPAMPVALHGAGEARGAVPAPVLNPGLRVAQAASAPQPARTPDTAARGDAPGVFRESIDATDEQAEAALDADDVAQGGEIAGLPAEAAGCVARPLPSAGAAFAGIPPALAMTLGAGSAAGVGPLALDDADAMTQAAAPEGRVPAPLAEVGQRMAAALADVIGRELPALRASTGPATAEVAPQAAPAVRRLPQAQLALPAGLAAVSPVPLAESLAAALNLPAMRQPPAAVNSDVPMEAALRAAAGTADAAQPSAAGINAAVGTATPVAAMPHAAPTATAEAASPDTAGRALLGALGDRIHMQAAQGLQRAVIRLDPHLAGSIVIDLRHEAGAISVQLSASHADVARQLQTMSDSLRQDLASRQYTEVNVQVAPHRGGREPGAGGHGQRDGEGQDPRRRDARRPGQAVSDAEAVQAFEFASR
ncbi:MAG: flagellar hook-length control protein FliK [Burkholderia gladioli]